MIDSFATEGPITAAFVGGNFVPRGSLILCARGHVVCEAGIDMIGEKLINDWGHGAFAGWRQREKRPGDPCLCEEDGCGSRIDFWNWSPRRIYAAPGETVCCEAGHPICDVASEIVQGTPKRFASQFTNWRGMPPPGDDAKAYRCPVCRGAWMAGGGAPGNLHFKGGWRVSTIIGGVYHTVDVDRPIDDIRVAKSFADLGVVVVA